MKNDIQENENIETELVDKYFGEKSKNIEEKISHNKEKTNNSIIDAKRLASVLGVSPSVQRIREVSIYFYVLSIFIFGGELPININALAIFGESFPLTIAMALGISAGILGVGDFSGKQLRLYSTYKKKDNLFVPIIVSIFVIGLCVFLGDARLEYIKMENQETQMKISDFLSFGIVTLNVCFYIITVFLSYIMTHPDVPRVREYNHIQKQIKIYEKEIERWLNDLAELSERWKNRKLTIRAKYEKLFEEIGERAELINNKRAICANKFNMVAALVFERAKWINAQYKKLVHKYHRYNYETRKDKANCNNWSRVIKDLVLINSLYQLCYPFRPGEKPLLFRKHAYSRSEYDTVMNDKTTNKESENNSEKENTETDFEKSGENWTNLSNLYRAANGKKNNSKMSNPQKSKKMKENTKNESKRNNRHLPAIIYPVKPFILLIISLIVFGCNQNLQETLIIGEIDQTPGGTTVRENISVEKLMQIMNVDMDDNRNNGGRIEISVINDISRNEIQKVELPMGSINININKRRKAVKKFKVELERSLDWAFDISSRYEYSKIASVMAKSLNKLAHTPADKKIYIIASDMMQNTRQMSFYNTLPQRDNYEKLMSYFESQHSLTDLTGIKIIIINKPQDADIDDAINAAIAFWDYYFSQKGAEVEVRANL